MLNRDSKDLIAVALLTPFYFCAGKLGLSMAFLHHSATAVWPPTGLAMAAMLLLGYRVWPAILVGAFLVNWSIPQLPLPSLAIAIGNTLEALVGAVLVRRFAGGANAFDEAASIFRFVCLAALPTTALSASIGIASLASAHLLAGGSSFAVWLTWWLGDFVSDLLVAPLLLLWLTPPWPRFQLRRFAEGAIMILAVWIFSRIVFNGGLLAGTKDYPLEYM